ncbi:MAG: transcription antitermination factor NusB [Candidatus Omnitrophica bacterium]|nr:transcription antitermination factor NusB [Candidatus Omnitrophota bacterium]
MRKRTLSRELALQILYQIDITRDDYTKSLEDFWQANTGEDLVEEVKEFTCELVKGVRDNLKFIDEKIAKYATNWELERMAVVDRNVLRLAGYELLFREDIPPKVSINEGVDLAKKYSGLSAGKFVNGILDKIKLERKDNK